MSDQTPAGWYPAPHANNQVRYWDGTRWHDTEPVAPHEYPSAATGAGAAAMSGSVPISKPNGLAITALVLGIVAFTTGLVPWLGLLVSIAAVAVGVVALVKKQSKVLTIIGLGLGGVALITGLIVATVFAGVLQAPRPDREPAALSEASPAAEPTTSQNPDDHSDPQPETEPAAEQPPAADGSLAHPYPQPYIARGILGGEKYSLTGRIVDSNAGVAVEEWNMFNSEAPAGFKYVVIELTMTGIDPDGVEPSLAEWDLYLATGEGNRYSNEHVMFGDGMSAIWEGPTLYPGSSFTGYAAYIVPESAQSFFIYDNSKYVSF